MTATASPSTAATSDGSAPLTVEVWRGDHLESVHQVDLAIIDAGGRLRLAMGDIARPVYPRSSIKPLQALQLVRSGAVDKFDLGSEHIALACASHSGEPRHIDLVQSWLERVGLDENALRCGPHPPSDRTAADTLAAAGGQPRRVHNNCSGKHTGLLSAALAGELAIDDYDDPAHPLQQKVAQDLGEWCDLPELPASGIDGCGLPNWPVPLRHLALGFARFAEAAHGRDPAVTTIAQAMQRHPELVAGEHRLCTKIMRAVPGVLAKTGAEGVYVAAILDRALGLALKVHDGATRASRLALAQTLKALGCLEDEASHQALSSELASELAPVLKNFAGTPVGRLQLAPESQRQLNGLGHA